MIRSLISASTFDTLFLCNRIILRRKQIPSFIMDKINCCIVKQQTSQIDNLKQLSRESIRLMMTEKSLVRLRVSADFYIIKYHHCSSLRLKILILDDVFFNLVSHKCEKNGTWITVSKDITLTFTNILRTIKLSSGLVGA